MIEAIQKLFFITRTNLYSSPETSIILEDILDSLLPVHSNQEEARLIATFCINFLNHKNMKGLLLSQKIIVNLIDSIFLIARVSRSDADIIRKLIRAFGAAIEGHPKKGDFKFNEKPSKPENPSLYFHIHAAKNSSYPAISVICHRSIRYLEQRLEVDFESKKLPMDNFPRKFAYVVTPFAHLARFIRIIKFKKWALKNITPQMIKDAIERGCKDPCVQFHTDDAVNTYERILLSAFAENYIVRTRRSSTSRRGESESVYEWGKQRLIKKSGKRQVEESIIGAEDPIVLPRTVIIKLDVVADAESKEGAYPTEDAEIVEPTEEESNEDITKKMFLSQIRPSQFPCFYERQSVPLNVYSALFCEFMTPFYGPVERSLDKMDCTDLAINAFFLILSFFGFDPKQIEDIQISSFPKDEEEKLFYDIERSILFYTINQDRLANLFVEEDKDSSLYRPSGNIVAVPVNGILKAVLDVFIKKGKPSGAKEGELLFQYISNRRKVRLSHEAFESLLKKAGEKHYFTVSSRSFRRSFQSNAINRYGMDPLVASYIAGREFRELRAQMFYSYVDSERIYNDAATFQKKFFEDILLNAKDGRIKQDFINYPGLHNNNIVTCQVGSRFVPNLERLKVMISEIQKTLESGERINPIEFYNTYTFYSTLLLMLTCGMRPIEIERLMETGIDRERRFLSVAGKNNRLYDESRLVPVLPIAIECLTESIKAKKDLYDWLIFQKGHSPEEIESQPAYSSLFFLAGGNGLPIPASSTNTREFLNGSGLFPLKLNSPRHMVRTYLFEKRVPHELIDAFMGHQTKGKEFLSFYSLKHLTDIRQTILPLLQEMGNELNLKVIPYMGRKSR